jgi:hypothetical protein
MSKDYHQGIDEYVHEIESIIDNIANNITHLRINGTISIRIGDFEIAVRDVGKFGMTATTSKRRIHILLKETGDFDLLSEIGKDLIEMDTGRKYLDDFFRNHYDCDEYNDEMYDPVRGTGYCLMEEGVYLELQNLTQLSLSGYHNILYTQRFYHMICHSLYIHPTFHRFYDDYFKDPSV